jgi:glutamate racemase
MPQDGRRVLGIIRPTAEIIGDYTSTKEIGIFATSGTVASHSYEIETHKMFPDVKVYQEACPMWVPLVENDEIDNEGANYFVRKKVEALFAQSANIDTILLACTHYPLLMPLIRQFVPSNVRVLSQGKIVASSLKEYMERHPSMAEKCSKGGEATFLTTDAPESFEKQGTKFYGQRITASRVHL